MEFETCHWCGLETEKLDSPTHRYMASTPGCWALFGRVLAREYENVLYWRAHELTVDAYALQHPGTESRQTINSINIHLASLYSYFVLDTAIDDLAKVKKRMSGKKVAYHWLQPPDDLSGMNVADIFAAFSPDEHFERVELWARFLFEKWEDQHKTTAGLLAGR